MEACGAQRGPQGSGTLHLVWATPRAPPHGRDGMPRAVSLQEHARYANGGAYPPDLSLITKARHNGQNYVFSLLLGYREPPAGISVRGPHGWRGGVGRGRPGTEAGRVGPGCQGPCATRQSGAVVQPTATSCRVVCAAMAPLPLRSWKR